MWVLAGLVLAGAASSVTQHAGLSGSQGGSAVSASAHPHRVAAGVRAHAGGHALAQGAGSPRRHRAVRLSGLRRVLRPRLFRRPQLFRRHRSWWRPWRLG
jgi:hypothetical protein